MHPSAQEAGQGRILNTALGNCQSKGLGKNNQKVIRYFNANYFTNVEILARKKRNLDLLFQLKTIQRITQVRLIRDNL